MKENNSSNSNPASFTPPSLNMPKGGGAIRGMGEKFSANAATGTGSMQIPLPLSPSRGGFQPEVSLSYDSGAGNGAFGFGWQVSVPQISRKTDKGIPKYADHDSPNIPEDVDIFTLSGAEDLVPVIGPDGTHRTRYNINPDWIVQFYRPRVEGLFARIERWTHKSTGEVFWRTFSQDGVISLYGRSDNSRISTHKDGQEKTFTWLLHRTYDRKGNTITYSYEAENEIGVGELGAVNEMNREDEARTVHRYLSRIHYGNKVSHRVKSVYASSTNFDFHHFSVCFDYGEGRILPVDPDPALTEAEQHEYVHAHHGPSQDWPVRRDPFSSYRSGFEVRQYRRCEKVLMYHHFPELGTEPTLVRGLDLEYADETSQGESIEDRMPSLLAKVTQCGYQEVPGDTLTVGRNVFRKYLKKALPSIEFEYSEAPLVDVSERLEYNGIGDFSRSQLVDLNGEGIPGMLYEDRSSAPNWYFNENAGEGNFHKAASVASLPNQPGLQASTRLMDLAGDGQLDLVSLSGPTPGIVERDLEVAKEGSSLAILKSESKSEWRSERRIEKWKNHRSFKSIPNIDWDHPNLFFVDLSGDGLSDVLVYENESLTWYGSRGEDGFEPARKIGLSIDQNQSPRVLNQGNDELLYLGDMSGDGLSDIVRVRNGEVRYWPNLGYGEFGKAVTLDNAPYFTHADGFQPERVRLADIDGTGNLDLIYFGSDAVYVYFNEMGNRLSAATALRSLPRITDLAQVKIADFYGKGTSCLLVSDPNTSHVHVLDMMGGQKPFLLTRQKNNLGAETEIKYVASTKYYLEDKAMGRPWITRLAFPVYVVESVRTYDHVSKNRFTSSYAYHHGYFDGEEREFRGFGMVEQWDTEAYASFEADGKLDPDPATGSGQSTTNWGEASHVPPVLTKTWFHTGSFEHHQVIAKQYEGEYYREGDLSSYEVPDTVLPTGLDPIETRQALRALKGAMLRREIYALDGSAKSGIPYQITESNQTIKLLQPRVTQGVIVPYAVFYPHARETMEIYTERDLSEKRVSHQMVLKVNAYGSVYEEIQISYGKATPDSNLSTEEQDLQAKDHLVFGHTTYTNLLSWRNDYRIPSPWDERSYELTGASRSGVKFSFTEAMAFYTNAIELLDGATPSPNTLEKRLLARKLTKYRKNNLGKLGYGAIQPLGLVLESHTLAFTDEIISTLQSQVSNLSNAHHDLNVADIQAAGYVQIPGYDGWWVPSGEVNYDKEGEGGSENNNARKYFYQPQRYMDPFGQTTAIDFDRYNMQVVKVTDPLGNKITAIHDYRTLQPSEIMDPNGNRSQSLYDALGLQVASAMMGKSTESLGDTLNNVTANLTQKEVHDFFENPAGQAATMIGESSGRFIYDLHAYQSTSTSSSSEPARVANISREIHTNDPSGPRSPLQISLQYSDGFERTIQAKSQAEGGKWRSSGWVIYNNKGKPVREYEPFFSKNHLYEFNTANGVSPVLFYDPLERPIATIYPNHTYDKVIYHPWKQVSWDSNDTLQLDPRKDPDITDYVTPYFDELLINEPNWETWYNVRDKKQLGWLERTSARKVKVCSNTPNTQYFDGLGRPFLSETIYKKLATSTPTTYHSKVHLDIQGNELEIVNELGNTTLKQTYDKLGRRIQQISAEAGSKITFADVAGKPILQWDAREHELRCEYDELRRLSAKYLKKYEPSTQAIAEWKVEEKIYGESQSNPETNNLRGQIHQHRDQSGQLTHTIYDFKGNLLETQRQFSQEYKTTLDWNNTVPLETQVFTKKTKYDGLNRISECTTPDNSRVQPTYNEANLLETVSAYLKGSRTKTKYITNINYNARGQRTQIVYANKTNTIYKYDPSNFRLTRLLGRRGKNPIQDLNYYYDPAGNITYIDDRTNGWTYYKGRLVNPDRSYRYDSLHRLIEAIGREHLGTAGQPTTFTPDNAFHINQPHKADGKAMGEYRENYTYDPAGNITEVKHLGIKPKNNGWTRSYFYQENSELEPSQKNNRLSKTRVGEIDYPLTYDAHGNMTSMPHLHLMQWDDRDQLKATSSQAVSSGTPETTYYVYDFDGMRTRKVTENQADEGQTPTRKSERLYMDSFEIFREYEADGTTVKVERETLHIRQFEVDDATEEEVKEADQDSENENRSKEKEQAKELRRAKKAKDDARVAIVERRTKGKDKGVATLTRYQLNDHLGTVAVELTDKGWTLSYEEYSPYGTTTIQTNKSNTHVPKRYRFTGKERDSENGLSYHGARYLAPWLGRWVSSDPRIREGVPNHAYSYADNNPVVLTDPDGREAEDQNQNQATLNKTSKGENEFFTSEKFTQLDRNAAQASSDVYKENDGGLLRSEGFDYNPTDGFAAALYEKDGVYILAFRGTEPKSIEDWEANIENGLNISTEQYDQAKLLAREVSKKYGENVIFTGHSLGGGLASAAASQVRGKAITFNAAGIGPVHRPGREEGIRAHFIEGDILSTAQDKAGRTPSFLKKIGKKLGIIKPNDFGLPDLTFGGTGGGPLFRAAGKRIPHKPTLSRSADPIRHSIEHFLKIKF